MEKLSYLLVLLSLVTSNVYVVDSYTLTASVLTQLGYNNQSTTIDIRNRIDSIDLNAFKGYQNLSFLILYTGNGMVTLDLEVFKDLVNLAKLTLDLPSLINMTNTKKIKFPYLQALRLLGGKNYKNVDFGSALSSLDNLTELYISYQLIQLKPNQFSTLKNLKELYLYSSNETILKKEHFNGLKSLENLYFGFTNTKK